MIRYSNGQREAKRVSECLKWVDEKVEIIGKIGHETGYNDRKMLK